MISLFINDSLVQVPAGSSVFQACVSVQTVVPRFCFHEKLRVAGNCRMCLVEIAKIPKPIASCAIPVMPLMRVFTDTPLVSKSREAVIEFLLINHPLDCPVCDQGGECDLQNQSFSWGSLYSRSHLFYKKSLVQKYASLGIFLVLTRCILCTRCVRFFSELSGSSAFGVSGRGVQSEISQYKLSSNIFDTLGGNVIDICPVSCVSIKYYSCFLLKRLFGLWASLFRF